MREFVARVNDINAYLEEFPPAFNKQQVIADSEVKDLLEFAIPTIWRVKMAEHAFRPINHDIIDIVEFCERLEFTESTSERLTIQSGGDGDTKMAQHSQSQNGRNAKRGRNGRDNNGTLAYAVSNQKQQENTRKGQVVVCCKRL
jgi:hypothetical protein